MSDARETSRFSQFIAEMRRRHVVRFAIGYAAVAFVALQLAEIIFPAFGIGEGGVRLLVVGTGLGFPPCLVLAWMYDLTREGIRRTADATVPTPLLHPLALGALLVATVVTTGAVGLYLADQGVFDDTLTDPNADGPVSDPVQLAAYDPTEPIRAIAVLPLDDYSPEGDQAYFTASMHEELIAKLSDLDEIRVVSRTTANQYAGSTKSMPEIGRELDADVVIEGSVTRTDTRTRVTLQLIHAASDSHIRTLQWDREGVDDILAFQTEIAHEVAEEVGSRHDEATFAQTVATDIDPAAQDLYFRGKFEFDRGTPEGYQAAYQHFEDAIAIDSSFAQAMAGMAGARFLIELEGEEETSLAEVEQARAEAVHALEMDSTSTEAREVLALIRRSMPRIFEGTVASAAAPAAPREISIVHLPGELDSMVMDMSVFDTAWVSAVTSLGERIEARVRERNVTPDRQSIARATLDARQLISAGRYGDAQRALERVVTDAPDSGVSWDMLTRAHVGAGDLEGALATVEAWSASPAPGAPDPGSFDRLRVAVDRRGEEAYWSWRLARLEARVAAGSPVPDMELANTHAALGHADDAFGHLFRALEEGDPASLAIRSDPAWDDLRRDPRYREAVRQVRSMRFSPTRGRDDRPGG